MELLLSAWLQTHLWILSSVIHWPESSPQSKLRLQAGKRFLKISAKPQRGRSCTKWPMMQPLVSLLFESWSLNILPGKIRSVKCFFKWSTKYFPAFQILTQSCSLLRVFQNVSLMSLKDKSLMDGLLKDFMSLNVFCHLICSTFIES